VSSRTSFVLYAVFTDEDVDGVGVRRFDSFLKASWSMSLKPACFTDEVIFW
jgi:hypothetical protein